MNRKEARMLILTDVYWLVLTEHKQPSAAATPPTAKWREEARASLLYLQRQADNFLMFCLKRLSS